MSRSQRIFVYGTARSGTTTVLSAFNSNRDCLILSEADIHLHWDRKGFAKSFNLRKWEEGTLFSGKGNIILNNIDDTMTGAEALSRLQETYRFVGDKFAVGPGRVENTQILSFLATHCFNATHIVSVRHPDSNVESLKKMFPEFSYLDLYQHWINSLIIGHIIVTSFPYAYIIFHEDLNELTMQRMAGLIGLELSLPVGCIGAKFWRTSTGPTDLTEEEEEKRAEAISYFELVQVNYDPETFSIPVINRNTTPGGLISENFTAAVKRSNTDYVLTSLNPTSNTESSLIASLHKLELDQRLGSDEAFDLARIAVEQFPESDRLNYLYGVILLLRRSSPDVAIKHFNVSLSMGGDRLWNLIHRAQAYLQTGDAQRAMLDIEEATVISPNNPQVEGIKTLIEANIPG